MPNAASLVTAGDAIRQVFDWFEQNGGTDERTPVVSFVPGVNVQIQSPLKSPSADEYAIGTSRQLGTRGTLRVDGVWRRYHDFYSQRADTTTGKVTDRLGNRVRSCFSSRTPMTSSGAIAGLTTQASYRIADGLDVGGNYTLSRLWGNFDGENAQRRADGRAGQRVSGIQAARSGTRLKGISPPISVIARGSGAPTPYRCLRPRNVTFGILQQIGSGAPYGALGTGNTGVMHDVMVMPNLWDT